MILKTKLFSVDHLKKQVGTNKKYELQILKKLWLRFKLQEKYELKSWENYF